MPLAMADTRLLEDTMRAEEPVIVQAASVQLPAVDVATVGQCTPVFPPYLADLR